jgi:addiction module HigA family antidote
MSLVRKMELSHPGKVLQTEVIEARNVTLEQGAELLGITESELSAILGGKASVNPIAKKISGVFGGNSDLWTRLQTSYDLDQSRLK